MVSGWNVIFTKQAMKDLRRLKEAGIAGKAKELAELLAVNPFQNPPPYEKLDGDLKGNYSRRINRQHRMVYAVNQGTRTVKVLSMWTHYENV